jgi:hypothetical protein
MPDTILTTEQKKPDFSEAWDRIGRLMVEKIAPAIAHAAAPLRSPEIAQLATSFAAAQKNFAPIPKNREVTVRSQKGDYKFKYATLDAILSATVPALAEQGLSLVQAVIHDPEGNPGLETTLYHSSGEWLRNITPMFVTGRQTQDGRQLPPSNQEFGSAQSYARRYGASALLCLAADEDDDGNIVDGNHIEGSRDVPYKGGQGGSAGGGKDFRPAGPRKFQGRGNGWVDDALKDGLIPNGDTRSRYQQQRDKATNPGVKAAAGALAHMEFIKKSRETIQTATDKTTLSQWWRDTKDERDAAEDAVPTEWDKVMVEFDAKMENLP